MAKPALIGLQTPSSIASPEPSSTRKKLIELMYFHADLFCGFQRHENKLAVFCRVEYASEMQILNTQSLDIFDKTFHRLAPQ